MSSAQAMFTSAQKFPNLSEKEDSSCKQKYFISKENLENSTLDPSRREV